MQIYLKTNPSQGRACLFVLMALLVACSDPGGDPSARGGKNRGDQSVPQSTPVELQKPSIETAASYYVTTTSIEPSSDANINARTGGVVRAIFHEEGDDVKAGDMLLQLEDDDQKLRLQQAVQKLASTEREYQRLNKMSKAGAVSSNEWEQANNNYLLAQTEKQLAELALSYTRVSAPFTGRVVRREVDLGTSVATGELLYRMMAISPLLVRVHIPATRIGAIKKGQQVELQLDSLKDKLQAEVELISPIVDPDTGTIKVTLRLDHHGDSVRPGDFVQVSMVTDQRENALLLPSIALIEERGNHYLFVADGDKAVRKEVKTGFVVGDKTEVVQGIQADERVVVKGQRALNDGDPIVVAKQAQADAGGEVSNAETQKTSEDKNPPASKQVVKTRKRGNS